MNNRAISPKGSAYVYVIGHEKREKCNSIVRIRLVLLLALNGNSLSGAEIVSCWGYNCRRGNPTKRRPARNILTRSTEMRIASASRRSICAHSEPAGSGRAQRWPASLLISTLGRQIESPRHGTPWNETAVLSQTWRPKCVPLWIRGRRWSSRLAISLSRPAVPPTSGAPAAARCGWGTPELASPRP